MQQQRIYQPHSSSIGNINANLMALLVYLAPVVLSFVPVVRYVAWCAPLVLYFMEKNSLLVKFHSMQAFTVQIVNTILSVIYTIIVKTAIIGGTVATGIIGGFGLPVIAGIGGIIYLVYAALSTILLVFEIIAMVKAYRYVEYRVPVAGKMAVWIMSKTGVNLF